MLEVQSERCGKLRVKVERGRRTEGEGGGKAQKTKLGRRDEKKKGSEKEMKEKNDIGRERKVRGIEWKRKKEKKERKERKKAEKVHNNKHKTSTQPITPNSC
jgi:hypothetical protein